MCLALCAPHLRPDSAYLCIISVSEQKASGRVESPTRKRGRLPGSCKGAEWQTYKPASLQARSASERMAKSSRVANRHPAPVRRWAFPGAPGLNGRCSHLLSSFFILSPFPTVFLRPANFPSIFPPNFLRARWRPRAVAAAESQARKVSPHQRLRATAPAELPIPGI